jgi:hypothetical protein
VPTPGVHRTDEELRALDVAALLRDGLHAAADPARMELFGDGVVAAALAADRLGVPPRSLAFLAEIVRRGGIGYAAGLPEPLPGAARSALARGWLEAAAEVSSGVDGDDELARWLDAVAVVVGVRRQASGPSRST